MKTAQISYSSEKKLNYSIHYKVQIHVKDYYVAALNKNILSDVIILAIVHWRLVDQNLHVHLQRYQYKETFSLVNLIILHN